MCCRHHFQSFAPAPFNTPPNVIVPAVLPTVNVAPELNAPPFVMVRLLLPLMIEEAVTLSALLPSVDVVKACNVPPLKFNAPVPNALVVLLVCNVPEVNVVAPGISITA